MTQKTAFSCYIRSYSLKIMLSYVIMSNKKELLRLEQLKLFESHVNLISDLYFQYNNVNTTSSKANRRHLVRIDLESGSLDMKNSTPLIKFAEENFEKIKSQLTLQKQLERKEKELENVRQVCRTQETNMYDVVKKKYEQEFKDKYCVGEICSLEKEVELYRSKYNAIRNRPEPKIDMDDFVDRESYNQLTHDMIDLQETLQKAKKKKGGGSEAKWRKNAHTYKKLYNDLLEGKSNGNESDAESYDSADDF